MLQYKYSHKLLSDPNIQIWTLPLTRLRQLKRFMIASKRFLGKNIVREVGWNIEERVCFHMSILDGKVHNAIRYIYSSDGIYYDDFDGRWVYFIVLCRETNIDNRKWGIFHFTNGLFFLQNIWLFDTYFQLGL